MSSRPNTAATQARRIQTASPSSLRSRPYSAGQGGELNAFPTANNGITTGPGTNDKATASSDELIRDLESKVRKVVEQKRTESDKLRYAVSKKRDDVERAKLILQDLLKESKALGLHYNLGAQGEIMEVPEDKESLSAVATLESEEDAERLQPIASISRRPVYSKHTKIRQLEGRLERRAQETHSVQRRTYVLEHIKKRLVHERLEITAETKQLKHQFGELSHQTQDLHKKEIAAGDAVNQVQTRLAQQKADMAASDRHFRCELELRQKWARERAKFEKYYDDQLHAVTAKAASASGSTRRHDHGNTGDSSASTISKVGSNSPVHHHAGISPPRPQRNRQQSIRFESQFRDEAVEAQYRAAFQRIGVDSRVEEVDPESIIRICLSHEELRKEFDDKHDQAVDRITQLRAQIEKARSVARENVPLSKRATSQRIETKQLEISTVERQLATVIDQYMFVDQSVRPIKIGLQQILQNVSNATVNADDTDALERTLLESCEEMMRLLRESTSTVTEPPDNGRTPSGIDAPNAEQPSNSSDTHELRGSGEYPLRDEEGILPTTDGSRSPAGNSRGYPDTNEADSDTSDTVQTRQEEFAINNFTSPFNVRIQPKPREQYFARGLNLEPPREDEEDGNDEDMLDVMDRAMVKRVSSVVMCTSGSKKGKDRIKHPAPQ